MDCNKNDECEQVTQAPQEFLDYWFFPEGSWWVYRNQDGEFDTVTCTIRESNFYKPEDAYGLIPCLYYYRCYYKHSNKKYFPDVGMKNRHSLEGLSSNSGVFWNLLASNNNNYYHFSYFFKYTYRIGDTIDFFKSGNKVQYSIIDDTTSFKINDSDNITNVIKIRYYDDFRPDSLTNNVEFIWLVKNISILKIQYFLGFYWELIDYKINK